MGTERQRGSKYDLPPDTHVITEYAALQAIAVKFARGELNLVVVLGEPGKGKSYVVKQALLSQQPTQDEQLLNALNISLENILGRLDPEYQPQDVPITGPPFIVKGSCSPISFHVGCFDCLHSPILIDDADSFFGNAANREQSKHIGESDRHKLMIHDKFAAQLGDVPKAFYTTSPLCIIRNVWDSADPINQAIESRGIFIYFDPTWDEWYKHCGTWFWDQEIFDYVLEKMPFLREPDIRDLLKAYDVKQANIPGFSWKAIFDSKMAEPEFVLMAEFLSVPAERFGGKEKRIQAWIARAKELDANATASRATWNRNSAKITRLLGQPRPERIILERTTKPIELCPPLPKRRENRMDSTEP